MYFGNRLDFDGATEYTLPGTTDLFTDCGLDGASPPAIGGLCVDTGRSNTTDDYWGQPRDGSPDLGAIEVR